MIRRAEVDDADAIAGVLHDAFIEYRSLYAPERYAGTVVSPEEVRGRLGEGPTWVALVDGAIIGTVGAVKRVEGLYIRGMGIVPRARGLRIGEQMLNEVEAYARENGVNRMFLGTTPFLHRAIRLYERFGFRFCETKANDSIGTPLLTMEKRLIESVL
jgi:GNAT superfamily N-acetyltransferase